MSLHTARRIVGRCEAFSGIGVPWYRQTRLIALQRNSAESWMKTRRIFVYLWLQCRMEIPRKSGIGMRYAHILDSLDMGESAWISGTYEHFERMIGSSGRLRPPPILNILSVSFVPGHRCDSTLGCTTMYYHVLLTIIFTIARFRA